MNGRRFHINILLLLMLGSCLFPSVAAATEGTERPVVVFLSDEEAAYKVPMTTFVEEIGVPVKVFNLKGEIDRVPELMPELLAGKPPLIFALGAKASYTAKLWTKNRPHIPVIFAMVLNWQRYRLLSNQDNITGIAAEPAPGTQFVNMIMCSPSVKRIGVIYSRKHSFQTILKARQEAEKLGLELVDLPITDPKDFRRAYKKMADWIDGFWMLADPVAFTLDNISWLEKRCIKDRIVCIGQSENIARMGVLLAVNPDIRSIGAQAASMAKNILLRNQSPKKIGVMPPLGTHLILNMKTADRIGLEISRSVMDMTSEIIEK